MTLEELLDQPLEVVEKMTPEQLDEVCRQYYGVTRPELVKAAKKETETPAVYINPQKKAALDKMREELGIDLTEFIKRKRKK